MNNPQEIYVLGTKYCINFMTETEDKRLKTVSGCTDFTTKQIIVDKTDRSDDEFQLRNMVEYQKKVLRHEIIHAFMYESGLDINAVWGLTENDSGQPEQIVDWIAIQSPKIFKLFSELNLL